jgi:hypothetical protein
MQQILGGAGRIFRAPPDDFSKPLGVEGTWWGRGVILQTSTIWNAERNPSEPRPVHFLLRFEFPQVVKYDPNISLEAAHVEAFLRLHGYEPTQRFGGGPLQYMMMAEQVYRYRDASDPYWDNERGLWWSSSEYRCKISNALV